MNVVRLIRKSGYGDYFAIDLINGNEIVDTVIYLKKNEEKEIKIRWEYSVFNSNGEHEQSEMVKGFIKFDGDKVMLCYDPEVERSSTEKYWWEPTEFELLNKSVTHFINPLLN